MRSDLVDEDFPELGHALLSRTLGRRAHASSWADRCGGARQQGGAAAAARLDRVGAQTKAADKVGSGAGYRTLIYDGLKNGRRKQHYLRRSRTGRRKLSLIYKGCALAVGN